MKAIILAAGRGSRMLALTDDRPKCFVEVQGKPLIRWQMDALRKAGVSDISIVRGYQADCFTFENVTYFTNPRWQETNMVVSLACAAELLSSAECIVSYSDIVYSDTIVRHLLNTDGDISLTYDLDWLKLWQLRFSNPLDDAETFDVDEGGWLVEIGGKTSQLHEIKGQYMGLMKFSPQGWKRVETYLATLQQAEVDKLDMTALFRRLLRQRESIRAVPVRGGWCEIDNENDLKLCTVHFPSLFS